MVSRVRKIHRSADRSIKRNAHDVASCACVSAALVCFFRCTRMAAVLSFSTRVEGKKSFVLSAPRNYPGAVSPQIARYLALLFFCFIACSLRGMKGNSRRNEPVCPVRELSRVCTRLRLTKKKKIELARVEARPKRCKICKVNATAAAGIVDRSAHRDDASCRLSKEIAPLIVPPVIWVNEVDKHTRYKIEKLKVPNTCRC